MNYFTFTWNNDINCAANDSRHFLHLLHRCWLFIGFLKSENEKLVCSVFVVKLVWAVRRFSLFFPNSRLVFCWLFKFSYWLSHFTASMSCVNIYASSSAITSQEKVLIFRWLNRIGEFKLVTIDYNDMIANISNKRILFSTNKPYFYERVQRNRNHDVRFTNFLLANNSPSNFGIRQQFANNPSF